MTSTKQADTERVQCSRFAFGSGVRLDPVLLSLVQPSGVHQLWCQGVAFGAAGRYAAAFEVLEPLTRGAAANRQPGYASLAASTIASHRRQLGGHLAAYRWDARAMRLLSKASGSVSVAALLDAVLGLAADAIGTACLARCDQLLRFAHDRVPSADWRARVRYGWVRTEWLLAMGKPTEALALAEETREYAADGPSERHLVKSAMQTAVCSLLQETERGIAKGRKLAEEALRLSLDRGMTSLVWPTALLLSGTHAEGGKTGERVAEWSTQELRELASKALTCVIDGADPAGAELARSSPWMPTGLLHAGESR